MHRHFYIYILLTVVSVAGFVQAQDPTPAPTPFVIDKQDVAPENIKGVPAIAPDYRSDARTLPDLGRVGVDMTQQRTLTLREAIELALDNNRDIEVSRQTFSICVRRADFIRPGCLARLITTARSLRTSVFSVQIGI